MAKTITLQYEGTDYTLEFTRESVEAMERQGFGIDKITAAPMTNLPVLFAGAFIAHHRFLKKSVIDDMLRSVKNRQALFEKLAEMYNDPLQAMLEEPEEDESKTTWGANW